jgi:thymidylate synthase (FAD)
MKLIKPSYEILNQDYSLKGIYKNIELAGRVCYKSEDKITENSAESFVERMKESKHLGVLEHGTVYLYLHWEYEHSKVFDSIYEFYKNNPYSKLIRKNTLSDDYCPDLFITTNYRVLIENNRLSDLSYLCEPTKYHIKRISVKFLCDRSISHEIVRHRKFSFCQESTRYCNYSKNKFNNELTFIEPFWIKNKDFTNVRPPEDDDINMAIYQYKKTLKEIEQTYLELLNRGWLPQQARTILPNSLKTEIIMTGFVSDWEHFFSLRSSDSLIGKPHPQMVELVDPLKQEFIRENLLT